MYCNAFKYINLKEKEIQGTLLYPEEYLVFIYELQLHFNSHYHVWGLLHHVPHPSSPRMHECINMATHRGSLVFNYKH